MRSIASATAVALAFALAGCGARPVAQPEGHIQSEARPPASIPQPVRSVPMPPAPEARDAEIRYSVVVANQPVRDVLMAMARETRINFDIHPGVEGAVTLNAIDQTLKQILTRIARQVDVRWEVDGQVFTVMPDTPYLKSYRVDYVNIARDVTETTGVATQVISGSATGTATANNSTLNVNSTSRHRFWETLEKNIKDLLRETDKVLPEGSVERSASGRAGSSTPSSTRTTTTRGVPGPTTTTGQTRSLADQVAAPAVSSAEGDARESVLTFREAASVIVSPETGIVSVRATSRQHERVAEFIAQITGSARRQVLIEATIVEVTLSDNYQSGVDWSALGINSLGYSFRQSFAGVSLPDTPNALGNSFFSIQYNNPNAAVGGSISSTVKLLDSFGKTRVLSSPKLMVLNNQTAMLKVVDNRVYFTVKADTVTNQSNTVTTFTTTQNVVPVGFIMNVTPQISDADMVTLNMRPTVSRIIDQVSDPNPTLRQSNIQSLIPVTQTREMESVLRVASGQTAILGGLMLDSFDGRREGLPIASRIPIFGDLVSQRNDRMQRTELVIFIRPIVIRDASLEGDLAAYRRYLPDHEFFRDTQSPLPGLEQNLQRLERGEFPELRGTPNPVVPDPPPSGVRP